MKMATHFRLLILALLITGCATQPVSSVPKESLSMIVWAKPSNGCDFENPNRDMAIVVSTTINTQARKLPSERHTYRVKDAQMLALPNAGETLCASLIRYQRISVNLAVYGMEIDATSQARLRFRPVYARVGDLQSQAVRVSLSVSGAHIIEGRPVSPQTARLDFGTISSDQPHVVVSGSRMLEGPTGEDVFRLVAIVAEDKRDMNETDVVSDGELIRLLSETNE